MLLALYAVFFDLRYGILSSKDSRKSFIKIEFLECEALKIFYFLHHVYTGRRQIQGFNGILKAIELHDKIPHDEYLSRLCYSLNHILHRVIRKLIASG